MSRAKGRALWLPDVLRDAGLDIVVEPGFEARGKEPQEWTAQVNHHTGSNRNSGIEPARGIVRDGRPDVPGPLANTLPRRDGTIRIIASGAANHPGVAYLPLRGGISSGVKYWALGHEIELDGIGEPFPTDGALYEAVHRMNAAIALYLGHDPMTQLFDHKAIAQPPGRKIDVRPYDLREGRIDAAIKVSAAIDAAKPKPTKPTTEGATFMAGLTAKQQREMYHRIQRIDKNTRDVPGRLINMERNNASREATTWSRIKALVGKG